MDAGAEQALLEQGASLLAVGICNVEGSFGRREAVRVISEDGRELARGLSALASEELEGNPGQLGVVIHRDHLVVIAAS